MTNMKKTILITGSTDGIGKATASALINQGHTVLLHGRSETKLEATKNELREKTGCAQVYAYQADLSDFNQVLELSKTVCREHKQLDVLINNAGVYRVAQKKSANSLDVRFMVNTIAPYLLTVKLKSILNNTLNNKSRVVNLSSAAHELAQNGIDPLVLTKVNDIEDSDAYAQSKLGLTMWSRHLACVQKDTDPVIIAVNPASFLGSNMVKDAYGIEGKDLQVGVDVLVRAALSEEFANASGSYFDNDKGDFSDPHSDVLDFEKTRALSEKLDQIIAQLSKEAP